MTIKQIEATRSTVLQLKRVAGYARVSVDKASAEASLRTQTDYLRKRLSSVRGWVDCGVFLDFGFTGTRTDRPGFQKLMEKCERGEIDFIITKSISRFCRNTVDLLSTVRHLKDIGVEVYFEEHNISTFSSDGELMLTILATMAQEESRSISENVLWSIRKRFERGESQPCNLMGYRWNGEEYVVVEDEASMVKEIYSLYLSGFGPQQISNVLNARGVKGLNGKPMSYHTVGDILRQEKYRGDSLLQKTFTKDHLSHKEIRNRGERPMYYVEDTHPQIIPDATFDAVQSEIERRRSIGAVASNWKLNTSIFTSRITCCECGRHFRRKTCSRSKYPTWYSWVCGEKIDRRKGGCKAKGIPEETLKDMVAAILGKDDYTEEEFNARIASISAGKYHEVTFLMTDGTSRVMTWKNKTRSNHGN